MSEPDTRKYTVAVIILNYNSWEYTVACIESIFAKVSCDLNYNIIVVDNNSASNDYTNLEPACSKMPKVKLVRSAINLGFSGGNMLGVQHSNADYLWFLNNDTILLNDNLSLFLDFIFKQNNVAICTAQMFDGGGKFETSIQYFPSVILKILGANFLRIFSPKRYPSNKIIYSEPLKVDIVAGASMFMDFKKFAEVGGFDTNIFLYCEEQDIGMKMYKAGYSSYLVPDAKYLHYQGKSTAKNLDIDKEYYISFFYYLRKHVSAIEYFIFVLYSFLKTVKKFYKGAHYLRLAFFILSFPGLEQSMKHKQRIRVS